MQKSTSFSFARFAAFVGVAFGFHLSPANAYCPYQCSGNYSNYCVSMCGYIAAVRSN